MIFVLNVFFRCGGSIPVAPRVFCIQAIKQQQQQQQQCITVYIDNLAGLIRYLPLYIGTGQPIYLHHLSQGGNSNFEMLEMYQFS